MKAFSKLTVILLALVALALVCQTSPGLDWPPGFGGPVVTAQPLESTLQPSPTPPEEQAIQEIELERPLSDYQAEVSGMAWFKEQLILLPQFPGQYASSGNDGLLFVLDKEDILAYLSGEQSQPLRPSQVPLLAQGLADELPGFEGFEAIAVEGETIYLTIETSNGRPMMGYLIQGKIEGDLDRIRLDPASLIPLPPRADLFNKSDEALVLGDGTLYSIYEANGAEITPGPVAYRFDLPSLVKGEDISLPRLEFRVTDATPVDQQGRFWVLNTFWPVDIGVATDDDPLAAKFGEGATHREFLTVERLVELQIIQDRIEFTEAAPIQLTLTDDFSARNWEGLARLDDTGFLLITDQHPATIFAFVPKP